MNYITHESVLLVILRVILGTLFFFQGFDKIFNVKISNVVNFFKEESRDKYIPEALMIVSAYVTTFIEFICGALLIVGLFKTTALYLLGIDLILVSAAFSYLKAMWDMQLLFPRLVLLSALLLLPAEWDLLSLDHLLDLK
jgi:putative oxidoreductase